MAPSLGILPLYDISYYQQIHFQPKGDCNMISIYDRSTMNDTERQLLSDVFYRALKNCPDIEAQLKQAAIDYLADEREHRGEDCPISPIVKRHEQAVNMALDNKDFRDWIADFILDLMPTQSIAEDFVYEATEAQS